MSRGASGRRAVIRSRCCVAWSVVANQAQACVNGNTLSIKPPNEYYQSYSPVLPLPPQLPPCNSCTTTTTTTTTTTIIIIITTTTTSPLPVFLAVLLLLLLLLL